MGKIYFYHQKRRMQHDSKQSQAGRDESEGYCGYSSRKIDEGFNGQLLSRGGFSGAEGTERYSLGHKVALRDIAVGEPIIKYGESIGAASAAIAEGEHVHTHNVEGCRGRGDKA